MKIININKIFFLIIVILSIIISSCKKAEDVPTIVAINTITDKLVADSASYKLLKQAVFKAGLNFKFKTTGAYTLFAPDDSAFLNIGITSTIIKDSISLAGLAKLILYHTTSPKILAANIAIDSLTRQKTLDGDSFYVYKNVAGGVFVNGIIVKALNKEADNGVIHKLSSILRQPTGNIILTAASVGLDSLVVAITRVNSTTAALGGDSTFTATLNNRPLTVFAPTNAAFRALLTSLSFTRISQIPVLQLKTILRYHLVTNRVFTPQLKSDSLTMIAGLPNKTVVDIGANPITIKGKNTNGLVVAGTTNNTCAITATNIVCHNGVVHVIDKVLLP